MHVPLTRALTNLSGMRAVPSGSPPPELFVTKRLVRRDTGGAVMGFGRGFLLWILGIPLPIILLLYLFHVL
jgi:hypothetical protein